MDTTTARTIARLHRTIARLAAEGRMHPVLAAKRLAQINDCYRAIAALREVRS